MPSEPSNTTTVATTVVASTATQTKPRTRVYLDALRTNEKGEVFLVTDAPLYFESRKLDVPKTGGVGAFWKGSKIPFDLWAQIVAFMQWAFKELACEAHCTLFYNMETQEWDAWAFPQENGSSTVHTLENEEYAKQRAKFPPPWIQLGSVHHHCSMGAFASGVDKSDETSRDGLHITLGKMAQDPMEIDSRATFSGTTSPTALGTWFETPEEIALFPKELHRELFMSLLLSQSSLLKMFPETENGVSVELFPEQWKTNCSKKTFTYSYTNSTNQYFRGFSWDDDGSYGEILDKEMQEALKSHGLSSEEWLAIYKDWAYGAKNSADARTENFKKFNTQMKEDWGFLLIDTYRTLVKTSSVKKNEKPSSPPEDSWD